MWLDNDINRKEAKKEETDGCSVSTHSQFTDQAVCDQAFYSEQRMVDREHVEERSEEK